jgi:hypothetical protein
MISNIPNIVPSNGQYTHEMLVTALRTMLNDYGGGKLDTFDLRLWLNLGLTKAAGFIRTYAPQYYTIKLQGIINQDVTQGSSLLGGVSKYAYGQCDLGTAVQVSAPDYERGEISWPTRIYGNAVWSSIVPYQYICDVPTVQISHKYNTTTSLQYPNYWIGLPHKVAPDQFAAIISGLNDSWRQDVVWTYDDKKVKMWFGSEVLINPSMQSSALQYNWFTNARADITVLRKPILDDLGDLSKIDANGPVFTNYREYVDCPDEAIGLLLQYAKEAALGVLGKPEDAGTKQVSIMMEQSLLTSLGHVQQQPQ